ncbi:transketolase [Salipaludibacillus aurantiacus]|uniref:Transketolase n=1 Tax=Salipaludibacillus aurantiacus TaxID=1601833 RepID=A0A1H9W3Y7_9BACI|nr:transketolase [Salipaludibacillus aurantiacus]SES28213.1 transketolase [Salipaludibacillus aurantiacus]
MQTKLNKQIDLLSINTIRTLSIDAIEKANSGHPGLPMGAAPMAYELWTKHMNHNPANPAWFNRDRFVLSAGHGSMLLYSLLHLSGYDLSMEEIKNFRQWDSQTPGHPEFGHTAGVEATTGPLGQGIAMAVGMAMAERHLAATYNKVGYELINHFTYSICGDGDLMEGVSAEAASLAGHLKLGRLVVFYDSNDISLDGDLNRSFSESVENRFKAYGWQVIRVEDGNNSDEINEAIEEAKNNQDQPTLIEVKTTIGYGSPNLSGTSGVHGAPLGKEETKLTKEAYKWPFEEEFFVPDDVYSHFKSLVVEAGLRKEKDWNHLYAAYKEEYPELAKQLDYSINSELPERWADELPSYETGTSLASRASSGETINAIAKSVPQLFGGSADLAGSNKTTIKDAGDFFPSDYSGRNIWFGVREFAMGAALNGMALHGGIKAFGGTFFVFSDYLRPAIRLAALMNLPVTYVFTHDSVAVGEDGPTHQPIEQLASLRGLPNMSVIRPADGNETVAAWRLAMESADTPTALILSRQNLPTIAGTKEHAYEGVRKGAYVVSKAETGEPQALLLASGSEVQLALEAQRELAKENISVSVISFPSWHLFESQSMEYKKSILPSNVKARLAIEMGSSLGWERYTGDYGEVLGINRFGASGAASKVLEAYGFTVDNVVSKVKKLIKSEHI